MKKIFPTVAYLIMAIIETLCVIGVDIMMAFGLYSVIVLKREDQYFAIIASCIMGIFGLLICIYCIGIFSQCIKMDKDKIVVTNLFGVIQKREWSRVKEIKVAYYPFTTATSPTVKYYVLIDDRENVVVRNGFMKKNTYIMIPVTKKNEQILRTFWDGEIIEE